VTRGEKSEGQEELPVMIQGPLFNNEIVWEFHNPYYSANVVENTVFRAYRYGIDDISWPVSMPDPNPETVDEVDQVVDDLDWKTIGLAGATIVAFISIICNIVFITKRKHA